MARNPIVMNEGGMFHFTDYVSQIPGFMQDEPDIVTLLQLFSDYLNNGYRNANVATQFDLIFVTNNSMIGTVQNNVQNLWKLMERCVEEGSPLLFMSKPQGNANPEFATQPVFRDYITYDGHSANLSSDIIGHEPINGDKYYVEYTNADYVHLSGVYVWDASVSRLVPDENGASQDPFNGTPNKPFVTSAGIVPRILQLKLTKIGQINTRLSYQDGNVIYYEVYFGITLESITDVTSLHLITTSDYSYNQSTNPPSDISYMVDYYNCAVNQPQYQYYYVVNFNSPDCSFDWLLNIML